VLDFIAERSVSDGTRSSGGGTKARQPVRVSPANTSSEKADRIPFDVTLVTLDRAAYNVGDAVVYELLLRHIGSTPFRLPWSRDPEAVRGAPRIQSASFLLRFTDKALGSQLVGSENILYGAPSVPDTILTIRPGETVRVRAASQWWFTKSLPEPPAAGWVRPVSVRAQVQINGINDLIPLIDSRNDVQIQFLDK